LSPLIVCVLVFAFCAPGFSQESKPAAQQTEMTPEQKAAQERMQLENSMLMQMQQNQTNPEAFAKLAEEFVQKFPDSQNMAFVRFSATMAYQVLNNFDKMVEHGLAALELVPNNPVIPATLANAYAENKKIVEAEKMANDALAKIAALQKPAQVGQAQWDAQINQLKCAVHATLGYVHLQKAKNIDKKEKQQRDAEIEKSINEFDIALAANPKDDISLYRRGLAYFLQNKVEESLQSYAKAVVLGGSVSQMAKSDMELVFKNLEETKQLKGRTMEQYLEKAKADLGIQ